MKRHGFTLIELAIVLTIVGVVIGGSFKALKSSREKAYVSEAKEKVQSAKDAVNGFAMEFIDLPTWNEFATDLSPVKGDTADQNRSFFYYSDPQLSNDIDICIYNSTNLKIDVYKSTGALDHTINNVAFVVAEQGINRNIQTGFTSSGAIDTVHVYTFSSDIDRNSGDFTRNSDSFDDIVSWVTLNELQQHVNCSKNKLEVLNNSAIEGNTTIIYNPQIIATRGIDLADGDGDGFRDYKWCIEGIVPGLNYSCNGTRNIDNNCSIPSDYFQCTSPSLSVTPLPSVLSTGNYNLKIYVKDMGDIPQRKDILLRITP